MSTVKTGTLLHTMPNFSNVRFHSPVQQLSFYATGVTGAWKKKVEIKRVKNRICVCVCRRKMVVDENEEKGRERSFREKTG